MKFVATIEARMTSSRLPGKVLMKADGKPMLSHLIKRLKKVKSIDEICIATTINNTDDPLEELAIKEGVSVYRGSENNVLSRVLEAAESASADVIVEITGDCPVLDPEISEQIIQIYKYNDADYVSNVINLSYPIGMDTQVFSLEVLKKSRSMTNNPIDLEHVASHIRRHPEIFKHINVISPPSLFWPELAVTLDEEADYILLKKIIENFGPQNDLFSCYDIIKFLRENPDLASINNHVYRKGDN